MSGGLVRSGGCCEDLENEILQAAGTALPNLTPADPKENHVTYAVVAGVAQPTGFWSAADGVWYPVTSAGVHGYSATHALVAGATVITHNLNLSSPFPVHVETRSTTNGAIVALRATAYTANSVTLSVPVAQSVIVTISKIL